VDRGAGRTAPATIGAVTRRVVVIAPLVPHDRVPHAGGQYLLTIARILAEETELTLLTPNTPTNREASRLSGTPPHLVVGERADNLRGRAWARVLDVVDRRRRRLDHGASSLPFAAALSRSGPARDALRAADVVSLEWSESIRLAGVVRRINPRARVLGTFHDVQSQLFAREEAPRLRDRVFWAWLAAWSRLHERRGVRRLDEVWVFSRKDAVLLGSPENARVVPPPLAAGPPRPHPPPGSPPTVLFVANLGRPENDEGARWLVESVWPGVLAQQPDARLRIAGAGASTELAGLAEREPSVELTGFVDDLDVEYAAAWVVAVPLRRGAGVKFKTIEALLHGVPVVTSSVGAEGIAEQVDTVGPAVFAGVHDDLDGFVQSLASLLDETDPALEGRRVLAAHAQAWAHDAYGVDAFRAQVRASYGLTG
jgi:glycosyltransferase involved in cell wall biosynthesis